VRAGWPVRIEWSPAARASARRYAEDQDGIREVGAAVSALATDPCPATAFHRGEYHRLRVGQFRVVYVVDGALITVVRVDRVS
jgi:mRNA-degrading endonuclease RelE of RelBE toxin-antitoxin system